MRGRPLLCSRDVACEAQTCRLAGAVLESRTPTAFQAAEMISPLDAPAKENVTPAEAKRFLRATRRHLKASRAVRLLGFELEAVEPGPAVLRMRAQPHHKQLNGVVHGGILAAMADTAAAIA